MRRSPPSPTLLRPLLRPLLRLRRGLGFRPVSVWYHPRYRLPLTTIESASGIEPRRADLVVWALRRLGVLKESDLHTSRRISYEEMALVHTQAHLESLADPEVLARIFGVDTWDVPAAEVMESVRRGAGATVDGARHVLEHGGAALNLLGGFHHAAPHRGAGLCPINDVAIAIRALHGRGAPRLHGRVVILDLDAHPPDGIAACLAHKPADWPEVWVGSLSGSDWGPLPRVHEVLLPKGTGDEAYLAALQGLLARVPPFELALVLAGGDVLAGDHLGRIALTLAGARRRDRVVARALAPRPQLWLSAGGYHPEAWRVLAGTALVLSGLAPVPIPSDLDPLEEHFTRVYAHLDRSRLGDEALLTAEDLHEALGHRPPPRRRLLGFYTEEGMEYALYRYGLLPQIRRLGYGNLRVIIDRASVGDRLRLLGDDPEGEHLLVECVLERRPVADRDTLFIHWLTLRNPRGHFSPHRPRLPGQEVPGLGLAREVGGLLQRMAQRLDLAGVAFRPAWYHIAYAMRHCFQFHDPGRQGRFEALVRDLEPLPLLEATHAVAHGRVRLDGSPYAWEPDDMLILSDTDARRAAEIRRVREGARFTLGPPVPEVAHRPAPPRRPYTDSAPPPGRSSPSPESP